MSSDNATKIDGRYRVLRELGSGSFGRVDLCIDEATGSEVALKRLHNVRAEPEVVRRFLREGVAAARVRHPGIVGVRAAGQAGDGTLYLASDYVEGIPLDRMLERGPPPLEKARVWIRQLADALEAVHAAGVIHRDLKPSNVLVSDGQALICDFGLARIQDGRTQVTATGQVLGTPLYLAPEAFQGASASSPRADVWALGAVAYELLVGAPWRVPGDLARLLGTEKEPGPSREERLARVPDAALRAALASWLEEDPAARPADGAAAVTKLAAGEAAGEVAGEVVEQAEPRPPGLPPGPAPDPGPPRRRWWLPPVLALGALLLLVGGLARDAAPPPPRPLPPAPAAPRDPREVLATALADLRLDDDALLEGVEGRSARDAVVLDAFASPGATGRLREVLEAIPATAPEGEATPGGKALVVVASRFRRLTTTHEIQALGKMLTDGYDAETTARWARVRASVGKLADAVLDEWTRSPDFLRHRDQLLAGLALLTLHTDFERARAAARVMVPRLAEILPSLPAGLAPTMARELDHVLRNHETAQLLDAPTKHQLLADLQARLRPPAAWWPPKTQRKVLRRLLNTAAFLLRRNRSEAPPQILEAFDGLLDGLKEAAGGDPEGLADDLDTVETQLEGTDYLAGRSSAKFEARVAEVRALRGS